MTTTRALSGASFLGFLLLAASVAHADAVPPPPTDCPSGAIGETGHNGPICVPLACATDADCFDHMGIDKRRRTCVDVAVCVEERKETSASGWSHGQPITRRIAHDVCAADGSCKLGACERGKHCALAETPAPTPAPTAPAATAPLSAPAPAKGCGGCDLGGDVGSLPGVLLAGWFLLRRHARAVAF